MYAARAPPSAGYPALLRSLQRPPCDVLPALRSGDNPSLGLRSWSATPHGQDAQGGRRFAIVPTPPPSPWTPAPLKRAPTLRVCPRNGCVSFPIGAVERERARRPQRKTSREVVTDALKVANRGLRFACPFQNHRRTNFVLPKSRFQP